MANSGSFSVSGDDTGDRFCNYPNNHRHQNQMLQQHQLRKHNHHQQLQGTAVAVAVTDADIGTESDDSHAALSTRSLLSASVLSGPLRPPPNITNLDSFLDSVTPIVAAQHSSEMSLWGSQISGEGEVHPFYHLGDLWETFKEWSAYGAGVPLLLYGKYQTTQYYVPFLSGMQLYSNPQNHTTPREERNVSWPGNLVFEYMEQEQPRVRRPLADKVSTLAPGFPELMNYRSCDLSPSSWICVAWYPIYRIPMGPTLKDLDASFLTIHSLSTQHTRGGTENGEEGVRLPLIGLASYKLQGSIISPKAPQEHEQENALFEAATNWLNSLQALLPDYQFFLKRRYSHWR